MAVSLFNRCADSKSPYVRSHSSNPTAWQLWSPVTLALARETNRLLFVSIGYSACREFVKSDTTKSETDAYTVLLKDWCHVMAHESFDHPRIAQLLNEHFIPVKIDREERPDIDRQYMDFQQATSGGGGWPLNVFVTPDLEPVFGGTYWPGPDSERAKSGSGFEDILVKVAEAWKESEDSIRASGKKIAQQLKEFAQEGSLGGRAAGGEIADGEQDGLELDLLEESFQYYRARYDSEYGGFGRAPKFPTPTHLGQMLRLGSYGEEVREVVGEDECDEARDMALKTLENMYKGGIKDQVGHGFARYSVTRDWSLPHFEKMLYDNAQLLPLFLDAWLLIQKPVFLEATHDVANYLTTPPMVSGLGGIHASEDADSLPIANDHEKREGAFYTYTFDEFKGILNDEEVETCSAYWGVEPKGNVDMRFDIQGELKNQNMLCIQSSPSELASKLSKSEDQIKSIIVSGREKLLSYRESNRPRPALDDKIVTAWNGLAIGGLARTGAALSRTAPTEASNYLDAAVKAASCIKDHLYDPKTRTLLRVYREGPGSTPGFADDYAFLISGLLDLYSATFDTSWLQWADTLQQKQIELFWDAKKHAFYSTPEGQPDILVRTKDGMDNAEPSVNGASANNLYRLGSMLNDANYEKMARQTVAAFEVEIGQHPGLFSGLMPAIVAAKLGMKGLMVIGDGEAAEAALRQYRSGVRPGWTLLRLSTQTDNGWLRERNELLKDLDGSKEMIQLCEGDACKLLYTKQLTELLGRSASVD